MPSIFDELNELFSQGSEEQVVEKLVETLRKLEMYPELFEALKMKHRLQVGLPAVALESSPPPTTEQTDYLERGLIEACREVGTLLLKQGKLQEGWMYLRPVGDRSAAQEALKAIEITSDNIDLFLSILVHEGIDIERGVEATLAQRGVCNTITLLESVVAMRDRKDQQLGVAPLLRRVHSDLKESVRIDLERRGLDTKSCSTIRSLIELKPDLLSQGAYHLDTSHLASTVRFSRILDDPTLLELAFDLCSYARNLHAQYQYPSEEPFADLYLMSGYFFSALLGENTEACLRVFKQKAESVSIEQHGSVAIETYVDLLSRVGHHEAALEYLIQKMPEGQRPFGIAPSLLDLSVLAGRFDLMLKQSQERGDLIGYTAALLHSVSSLQQQES